MTATLRNVAARPHFADAKLWSRLTKLWGVNAPSGLSTFIPMMRNTPLGIDQAGNI